jgi:hypothetical protein
MNGRPLRVRITGDVGDPRTLEVTEVETGTRLNNVLAISIVLTRDDTPTIDLTIYGPGNDIDLTGYANVTVVS